MGSGKNKLASRNEKGHISKVFQGWETQLLVEIELKRLWVIRYSLKNVISWIVSQSIDQSRIWLNPSCSKSPMTTTIKQSGKEVAMQNKFEYYF